ncbi:Zn-ribbon domain-containing protein [Nanoarchaeota archaeon]
MPHQCVRCGIMYNDTSIEIIEGCPCGAKLFFYIKKKALEKQEELPQLSKKEKVQIEKDVLDIIGQEEPDKPVILDIESIKIIKPGKFELDLVQLFNKKQPLVYKLEDGKYVIDIAESFSKGLK